MMLSFKPVTRSSDHVTDKPESDGAPLIATSLSIGAPLTVFPRLIVCPPLMEILKLIAPSTPLATVSFSYPLPIKLKWNPDY